MTSAYEIFERVEAALSAQAWFGEALTRWPSPIANELAQLQAMLRDGKDAGGILMQTRDVAEVLLKTLTLATAADILAGGDTPAAAEVNVQLADRSLALGGWFSAFQALAKALTDENLMAPEAKALAKGDFAKAFADYIANRNDDIGHGAYRPDSIQQALLIEKHLLGDASRDRRGLCDAYAVVWGSKLWEQRSFRLDTPDGAPLTGVENAQQLRGGEPDHKHAPRPLFLSFQGRSAPLAPFIAGRVCDECGERDAFLFEGPRSQSHSDYRVDFLDYANGHRLRVDARQSDARLTALLAQRLLDRALKRGRSDGEFTSGDVVRLLDDIMFDKRFINPEWLRRPLKEVVRAPSSALWVRAPGHVGKTLFVRGLHGEGLKEHIKEQQQDLLEDGEPFLVLPVFLKREYRVGLVQFKMNLESLARRSSRLDTRLDLTFELGREAVEDRRAAFVRFVETCVEAAKGQKVLIAVDGLDELPDPGSEHSVVDVLPDADSLPDGAHLLLTSRPLAQCPPWLQARAAARPGVAKVFEADTDNPDYQALLRDYIGRHSGVEPKDPDFERVVATLLRKSDGLFLFVSFICDQMRDAIAPADAPL